jgi:4-amino-4-deoxy-L-arabinose transferase-like glycosyltransferase
MAEKTRPDRRASARARRAAADKPSAVEAPSPAAPFGDASATVAVSLDALVWVALIAFATLLHFVALGRGPLSVPESARAFDAWLVSEGAIPTGWSGDATSALTSHLFRLFGDTETVARIIPALAGSALVASFWWAGRYFGRGVALLAGVLVALSPLTILASRSLSGFALGGLLSMVMVLSLLAYVERPRTLPAVALAASFGLALGSDVVATSTAIALAAFVAFEWAWRRDGAVSAVLAAFRANREHWQPASLALATTLLLAVAQFGTDVDRLSLPGLQQWVDAFGLPKDDLPWHYQLSLLFAYELPILIAGAAGYAALVDRWAAGAKPLTLAQRLLLAWTTVAVIVVVFATRRESGQLLVLLLPLSLLAAALIEELVSSVDWSVLVRWWVAPVLVAGLVAYTALQLTRWAEETVTLSGWEKTFLAMALVGALAIVAGGFYYLGRNGLPLALPLAGVLALSFAMHSSLSVAVDDGDEFAAPNRLAVAVEPLRTEIRRQAGDSGLPVAIDPALRDALGWPFRGEPIAFGDPGDGSAVVLIAGPESPSGMQAAAGPYRIVRRWAPDEIDPIPTWRWFVYRERYGSLSTTEVQVFVPIPAGE